METTGSFQMWIPVSQTTWSNVPKDRHINIIRQYIQSAIHSVKNSYISALCSSIINKCEADETGIQYNNFS